MSAPSHQNSSHFSVDKFAAFFSSKVDKIRESTSISPPPVIKTQLVTTPFSIFEPVGVDEVTRLLSRTPVKHCSLDPSVPIWLMKLSFRRSCSSILSENCKVSLQSGDLAETQTSALVFHDSRIRRWVLKMSTRIDQYRT